MSETPQILSVEQLNIQIRNLIENQVGIIWVQAEISNFKPHSSGHFYFSLKDSKSQISAIMFRGHNSKLKFKPHDGLEVIVRGRITVYEPRGSYQIACESMEPVGAGALQKEFEQLKEKLKSEGLFELNRKKAIPSFPQTVAIVTSSTGAAIQDILNIMARRAPAVQLIVVPTIVQGAAAGPQICEAYLKAVKLNPDVIIIGRGGGSIEDMWCFNNETLARVISNSHVPTISAVGHEIDFTICDFVSDLRAPTPSAAAELVAKNSADIIQKIQQLKKMLMQNLVNNFDKKKKELGYLSQRVVDPQRKLQDMILKNDDLLNRLENGIVQKFNFLRKDIQLLENKMISPEKVILNLNNKLKQAEVKLNNRMLSQLSEAQFKLSSHSKMLDSLSPLKVVDRGFIIARKNNELVNSVKKIKTKDIIELQLKDGHVKAEVIDIN